MRTFRTLFFTALACLGVMIIVNPPIDHSAGYVGYKIGNAVGAGLFLLAWGAIFAALGAGTAQAITAGERETCYATLAGEYAPAVARPTPAADELSAFLRFAQENQL